jgi:hypothetical protein
MQWVVDMVRDRIVHLPVDLAVLVAVVCAVELVELELLVRGMLVGLHIWGLLIQVVVAAVLVQPVVMQS